MIVIQGKISQYERSETLAILSGWISAYCNRAKRFPSFESLISKKRKQQTMEEQIEVIKQINSVFSETNNG